MPFVLYLLDTGADPDAGREEPGRRPVEGLQKTTSHNIG